MRPLLFAALLIVAVAANADPMIQVEQPWARATPGGSTTGVVYLTLTDHGDADRVTGISTPVAGMAMIHESYTEAGIARMRMLDGVALPTHQTVTFKPGGLHIMLDGLKQPLKLGTSFPLTLSFAKAPPVTVSVSVLKAGAPGPAPAAHSHDMKTMAPME